MLEQERFIVRLQQRVLRESTISACFLSGSFGKRTNDSYSDIDIGLIFENDALRDAAWANRQPFARSVLPYVSMKSFDATHIHAFFHIALYSNGSKADYRFLSAETPLHTAYDAQLKILKDRDGTGAAYQEICAKMNPARDHISAETLKQLDDRFWIVFWEVYRCLLRGDCNKSFKQYLILLAVVWPPFLNTLPASDPARLALIDVQYNQNDELTRQALKRLLKAYKNARTAIVDHTRILFTPDSSFERSIERLL